NSIARLKRDSLQISQRKSRLDARGSDKCTLAVCLYQTNIKAGIFSTHTWQKQGNTCLSQICHDLRAHRPVTNSSRVACGQPQARCPGQEIHSTTRGQ